MPILSLNNFQSICSINAHAVSIVAECVFVNNYNTNDKRKSYTLFELISRIVSIFNKPSTDHLINFLRLVTVYVHLFSVLSSTFLNCLHTRNLFMRCICLLNCVAVRACVYMLPCENARFTFVKWSAVDQ